MNRPNWTVIWTDEGFAAIKLVEASIAMKPMSRHEAERKANKANRALVTVDVAERFGAEGVA